MNLPFSRQHGAKGKEKPTNFEAKIKAGIKIHTIRDDAHDRWKPGMAIHFWIGTPRVPATKAERIFVIGDRARLWQKIQDGQRTAGETIKNIFKSNAPETWIPVCWTTEKILIYDLQTNRPGVVIGRKILLPTEIEELASNDGFETVEDFFNWFRKPTTEKWWDEVKGKYANKKTLPTEFEGKIIHWTEFCYDSETASKLTI